MLLLLFPPPLERTRILSWTGRKQARTKCQSETVWTRCFVWKIAIALCHNWDPTGIQLGSNVFVFLLPKLTSAIGNAMGYAAMICYALQVYVPLGYLWTYMRASISHSCGITNASDFAPMVIAALTCNGKLKLMEFHAVPATLLVFDTLYYRKQFCQDLYFCLLLIVLFLVSRDSQGLDNFLVLLACGFAGQLCCCMSYLLWDMLLEYVMGAPVQSLAIHSVSDLFDLWRLRCDQRTWRCRACELFAETAVAQI